MAAIAARDLKLEELTYRLDRLDDRGRAEFARFFFKMMIQHNCKAHDWRELPGDIWALVRANIWLWSLQLTEVILG